MALQSLNIFYNVDIGRQSGANGEEARQDTFPLIYRQQKDLIVNVDFIRTGGGAATGIFLATDTFEFAADVDFISGTVVALKTLNTGFNTPGDRPDLDVAGGKITFRVDGNTVELVEKLGSEAAITLFAEIKAFPLAISDPKAVFQFIFNARNLVDPAGGVPNPPISNFFTKAEILSLIAGFNTRSFEVAVADFKTPATFDLYTVPAGKLGKVVSVEDVTDAISGGGTPHTFKAKTDDGPRDLGTPILSTSDTVGRQTRVLITDLDMIPAGSKVQAEITIGSTFTTHSGRFLITVEEKAA